jgi:hypothetical protein|tara:strand:+ start:478 stop:684 length:207 start_codon:yes stop_codon:yes gene_type:complete
MNKGINYVVFDKKDRWMGGYSTQLEGPPFSHATTAKEMAIMNAKHCGGIVFEVCPEGNKSQVYPKKGS